MKARLSSLLAAGAVVVAAAASIPLRSENAKQEAVASGLTVERVVLGTDGAGATLINVAVPGFSGTPRLEVLHNPSRVVVDLPGVHRGTAVSSKDVAGLSGGLVLKARMAQYASDPVPVTRMVLEVAPGTQVAVSPQMGGVSLTLAPGSGKVLAQLIPAVSDQNVAAPAPTASGVPLPGPDTKVAQTTGGVAPVPQVGLPFQPIPAVTAASLLPASPAQPQERAQADPAVRPDRAGKTLGEVANRYSGSRMTIDVKGADIQDFLRLIAEHAKLNLVADQDVTGTYSFMFYDTPWDQVLDIILKHAGLGKEISNGVIRVAKVEKLQKEEEDRKRLDEAKALAGDLTTITRPLSFAKVGESKGIIEKMLSKRGSLIIDDRTNTLIITDLPKYVSVVDDLIATLDIQIQQVQIEARVVEASKGLSWEWGTKWPNTSTGAATITDSTGTAVPWGSYGQGPSWNSSGGFNRPASNQQAGTAWTANNPISNPAGEFWVSFLSNKFSVNVILQAMERDGKVKIVSSPKVVTQNNRKAKILAGEKIPYPTQQGGAQGGAITVAFVDANLELDVTPQITNDGTIIMDIKVEKAEADFSTTVQGTPRILRKALETQVLVKDGGTAVLGGVYTTNNTNETQGVPFLSKIPVLGWLFKSKKDSEKTAELLIFITPRIIKS